MGGWNENEYAFLGAGRSGFGDSVLESGGHGTRCLVPIATLVARF